METEINEKKSMTKSGDDWYIVELSLPPESKRILVPNFVMPFSVNKSKLFLILKWMNNYLNNLIDWSISPAFSSSSSSLDKIFAQLNLDEEKQTVLA